jgi:hypothetical protein
MSELAWIGANNGAVVLLMSPIRAGKRVTRNKARQAWRAGPCAAE